MHLRITKQQGRWSCAQVDLNCSLRYGTYRLLVRDTSHLEPAAVFSMTTFDQWGMTSISAKWTWRSVVGVTPPTRTMLSMRSNPFTCLEMFRHLRLRPALSLTSCAGSPGAPLLRLSAEYSRNGKGPVVAEHHFSSGVPTPGQERVQLFSTCWRAIKPLEEGW
jgi:hypothetical protein